VCVCEKSRMWVSIRCCVIKAFLEFSGKKHRDDYPMPANSQGSKLWMCHKDAA